MLSFALMTPSYALSEDEVDSLLDEGERMRILMLRMQTQFNQSATPRGLAFPAIGSNASLSNVSAWSPMSAMFEGSLQEQWFRFIEQGVLGRFSDTSGTGDGVRAAPVTVDFVEGKELPWYGAVQVRGYAQGQAVNEGNSGVRARLMVAPRFEDGSFLHVGLSFHSIDYASEEATAGWHVPDDFAASASSRGVSIDLGYTQNDYSFQAKYLKSSSRENHSTLWPDSFRPRNQIARDGFYINGAWRLMGEETHSHYNEGLLAHIIPRAKEGVWDLVVRYANLGDAPGKNTSTSSSMLLGVHWKVNPTLALELDFVEGAGENFELPSDSDLSLRGIVSF